MILDHPSRTYSMPSGVPFLTCLARGLRAHLGQGLGEALILLPTRRAVRALGDAFVEEGLLEGRATVLPRMRPLADIDTDDVTLEPEGALADMAPAIPPLQRRFELARLSALYHNRESDIPLTASNAMAMAQPLADILDDAAMEEAGLPNHETLEEIRARAAQHFQHASVFYEILRTFWPDRLSELKLMGPKERQVRMLDALREEWETNPPAHPIIVAGSTGTLGATARLIACVRQLPKGLVVLPGVDLNLRADAAWDAVDPQHPQHSIKALLETMGVGRDDIHLWPAAKAFNTPALRDRRRILSEALVPVTAAQDWPERIARMKARGLDFAEAAEGISLLEARHEEEEALAIALAMRHTLETPGRTAALVTPDAGIARRVRTRLARWGVEVDDSKGVPLEETALGAYLLGVVKLAMEPDSAVDLAYVCKHRLTGLGEAEGKVRRDWLDVEIRFHGRRPGADERAKSPCLRNLDRSLQHLTDIATATPDGWARALVRTVEDMASTDSASGAERLWADEAGETAAGLLEDIILYGGLLDPVAASDFHDLLFTLMRERVVRTSRGTHPRLSILGPLESRMLSADRLILAGLNEGTWPALPSPTPYLSRDMRTALGLSLPERRFGLAAHDFAQSAAHRDVILTRSRRTSDGPTVASRWLWRLKTLMRGAMPDTWEAALAPTDPYLEWARDMDACPVGDVVAAKAPAPTPHPDHRWPNGRKLSITRIKTWVRDPYSIYAREVLGLEPIKPLDVSTEVQDWGTLIHKALETYFRVARERPELYGADELSLMFESELLDHGFPATDLAKERARLRRLAEKVVAWSDARLGEGWQLAGNELRGELHLPDQDFRLTGYIDHIEVGPEGYSVVDFKTGSATSAKEVAAGFDPQLPLAALMLKDGTVGTYCKTTRTIRDPLKSGETADLIYGVVKGYNDQGIENSLVRSRGGLSAQEYRDEARALLITLIESFDRADTPYHSQPRRKYQNVWGDYDQLARRGEWSEAGED